MSILKNIIFLKSLIILVVFTLDRMSKNYILNLFYETQFQEIYLSEFINIYFIWNKRIAFGLLNFEDQTIYTFISYFIVFISLIILFIAFKNRDHTGFFFAMILGGSLGNLFDRFKYSAVPDFIDLHVGNFHWFIFNVADIFITVGVVCLIFVELFYNKKV